MPPPSHSSPRLAWAVLAAALTFTTGCPAARTSAVAPVPALAPAPAPRLVVMLVIDQLPSWSFERRLPALSGGIARLAREGRTALRASYPYAYTLTASGHATLGTGAPPSATGIIGNTWYRRDEGVALSAEVDRDVRLLAVDGGGLAVAPPDVVLDGASSRQLLVPGLAEAVRAAGGGRTVAIALKARAACFVAGQRPDVVVFYEEELGGFTTSTAYAEALPAWLPALRASSPPSRFDGASWTPLEPDRLGRLTGITDDEPGEGSEMGTTFPHVLPAPAGRGILETPFGDELVVDAAIAAIDGEALGQGGPPDLLAVSFSSHDYAGHLWGQESWEVADLLLRLDEQIGRLLDALDARVGPDGYAVVLTSDHGATPMIDRHPGAARYAPKVISAVVDSVLDEVIGPDDWVVALQTLNVYLAPRFQALPEGTQRTALAAAARAVAGLGVDAIDVGALAARCASGASVTGLERLHCASYRRGRSGELALRPPEGSLITSYPSGTHHDAPSAANREVPLIVRVPGVAPGELAGPVDMRQVAPTVARLLGVAPPSAALAPPVELPR